MTTLSPWVVTTEALAPFRIAQPSRPEGDPQPLPYLWDARDQTGDTYRTVLPVHIATSEMRMRGLVPHQLSRSGARHLYWTLAQLLTHRASGGCDLRPGDLFGTETILAEEDGFGSPLELTRGGRAPVCLSTGETRGFTEDGDELTFTGQAVAAGRVPTGFGECQAVITPAL